MKALRTFFIALPIAWILSFQVAPAFWHGSVLAEIFALVTGNVTYYVNASTGSDSNSCLSSGSPCKTLQHADYLLTQTWVWGINIGAAKIILADGTYTEANSVTLAPAVGLPFYCANCFAGVGYPNVIEIAGDDTTPANVIVTAPTGAGTCRNGAYDGQGGIINVVGGTYYLHGFTITASGVIDQCSDLVVNFGATVLLSGTMDFGPANWQVIQANGKVFTDGGTLNITQTGLSIFEINNGGAITGGSTNINYVGTNTVSLAAISAFLGGEVYFYNSLVITGTVSGPCYTITKSSVGALAGGGYAPGCTFASGQVQSTDFGRAIVESVLATDNVGVAPTVTGTDCTQSDTLATDTNGEFTETNGSTGCTVAFVIPYPLKPVCHAWRNDTGAGVPLTLTTSGSTYTGFTNALSASGTILIQYACIHHW